MRAALLLVALATGGCADTRDTAAPPPPSPSPAASATPSPFPQTSRCENPDEGYALSYPFEWSVGGGPGIEPCTFFDAEPLALEPGTEATGVGIRVDVRDVPLARAREDQPGEQEERTVAGRDAVRATGTYGEDPLLPPGTQFTTWLVDLGGRTLLITADDAARGDYAEAVEVLDEMVATLEVL